MGEFKKDLQGLNVDSFNVSGGGYGPSRYGPGVPTNCFPGGAPTNCWRGSRNQ